MDCPTLLDLAKELRAANARVSQLARERVPEAEPLVEHEAALLETLVSHIRTRELHVERVTASLMDRLNNLLMSVQTVSDLLRNAPDDAAAARLRRHLDDTVGMGRESLKTLRDAVGQLR